MCSVCHSSPCLAGCPNAPEPKPVYTCKFCGEGIFAEDHYVEIDGDYYHAECLENEMPFENLMQLFGCTVQIAQEDF